MASFAELVQQLGGTLGGVSSAVVGAAYTKYRKLEAARAEFRQLIRELREFPTRTGVDGDGHESALVRLKRYMDTLSTSNPGLHLSQPSLTERTVDVERRLLSLEGKMSGLEGRVATVEKMASEVEDDLDTLRTEETKAWNEMQRALGVVEGQIKARG